MKTMGFSKKIWPYGFAMFTSMILASMIILEKELFKNPFVLVFMVVMSIITFFWQVFFWIRSWRLLFLNGFGLCFIFCINTYYVVNCYYHLAIRYKWQWDEIWGYGSFANAIFSVCALLIQCLIYLFLFIKWVIDNRQGHAT